MPGRGGVPTVRSSRRGLRLGAAVVITVLALTVVQRMVGDIDWSQVGEALGKLSWWQPPILVAGLLVRQVLNALPLSLFIPGCTPARAFVNDQAAILLTTVAPPPTDVVMRLAMFGSWGIPASAGLAGTVMNTVSFYVVRFGAPLLGVLVLALSGDFVAAELWVALASGSISVGLLLVLWLSFRTPAFAAATGRAAGRLVQRVRPGIDPDSWATSVTEFRSAAVDRIGRALPLSVLALVAMVLVDLSLIVLSIRFVGVTGTELPALWVLTAFLLAYPLTLSPFSGLGLLDAVVIGVLVTQVGVEVEPGLVAAFIIWRTVTLGTPLLLGTASMAWWRASGRDS